jgi:ornithine cyclodeaminase
MLLTRHSGLDRMQVAGRDAAKVARLVDELADVGPPVEAARSIEEGVRCSDIACTTTHSDRLVVRRQWLRPGTHVYVVGVNASGAGDVDAETSATAWLSWNRERRRLRGRARPERSSYAAPSRVE